MKKLTALTLLLISFTIVFGQEKKVKHTLFDFKTKSNYSVIKKDSVGITLTDSLIIQDLPILNKIEVKKSRISPKKNGIKSISDLAKFERWSISDFIKSETTKKVFFTIKKTEYFDDLGKTKLIGYKFENNNFIIENEAVYSVNFSSEIKLNDLETYNDESEFKILDKSTTNQIMISHINSGDLNKIIETLKVK